jgi:hypothetical protein
MGRRRMLKLRLGDCLYCTRSNGILSSLSSRALSFFHVIQHMSSTSKKRKLSGLSGLELQLVYNSLLKLKKSIVYEEPEEEEGPLEGFEQQVDMMTRATKRHSINSLPAASYLLQYDYGGLDQVENYTYWHS